jgi:hypothetical protein
MQNKIYPTGKFNDLDSEGYILNSGVYPVIQKEYKAPVQKSIDAVLEHFSEIIHSIYLRGSVAKGIAILNVSDIDFIFISTIELTKEEKSILYDEIEPKICVEFPYINGIELHFQTLDSLQQNWVQFMMSTQCVCIYGEDLNLTLPKFKIDENAYSHIGSLESDISSIQEEFIKETNSDEIKSACTWIMKRIVRVGFEICIRRGERAQKYTRDLYPCYEVFSEYYPERKAEMFEALTLAIYPIDDKDKIDKILCDLGQFLISEIKK